MRSLLVAVAVAALVIPLAVHAQQGGVTAEGWEVRLDRGTDVASVLSFMTMASGVHATTGRGAAIFWQPTSMAKGAYSISASFTQAEPSNHPNAYVLFFGGSDLAGPNQRLYRLRVVGQWFDGIRFYAAASSPRRSRRTWAGLR